MKSHVPMIVFEMMCYIVQQFFKGLLEFSLPLASSTNTLKVAWFTIFITTIRVFVTKGTFYFAFGTTSTNTSNSTNGLNWQLYFWL